VKTNPLN